MDIKFVVCNTVMIMMPLSFADAGPTGLAAQVVRREARVALVFIGGNDFINAGGLASHRRALLHPGV
jgi:hypothetical protein